MDTKFCTSTVRPRLSHTHSHLPLGQESKHCLLRVSRKHLVDLLPQMTADELAQDVTEVRRHREIATFVELLGLEAGPLAVELAAAHAAAEHHHHVAVAMVGA